MRLWKLLDLRVQAKLAKGVAKDVDKTQEVIEDSDYSEVICNALETGKLKFKPKKKGKNSETVVE